MSDTVKEFMEKPVKKYACGEKARQAQKTLQNTFTASSAKSAADEKRLLSDVLETLNKTDSGRSFSNQMFVLSRKILSTFLLYGKYLSRAAAEVIFSKRNFSSLSSSVRAKRYQNPSIHIIFNGRTG